MLGLLSEPLRLPCGQVLPNRLAKAAMTEGLDDPLNRATEHLAEVLMDSALRGALGTRRAAEILRSE